MARRVEEQAPTPRGGCVQVDVQTGALGGRSKGHGWSPRLDSGALREPAPVQHGRPDEVAVDVLVGDRAVALLEAVEHRHLLVDPERGFRIIDPVEQVERALQRVRVAVHVAVLPRVEVQVGRFMEHGRDRRFVPSGPLGIGVGGRPQQRRLVEVRLTEIAPVVVEGAIDDLSVRKADAVVPEASRRASGLEQPIQHPIDRRAMRSLLGQAPLDLDALPLDQARDDLVAMIAEVQMSARRGPSPLTKSQCSGGM